METLDTTCVVCNRLAFPLSWHHIDPSTKHRNVAHLIAGNESLTKLKVEIKKCKPMCWACHLLIEFFLANPDINLPTDIIPLAKQWVEQNARPTS